MNNSKLAFWMKKKKLYISEIVCCLGLLVPTAMSVSGFLSLLASVISEACTKSRCFNCVSSLSFIYLINPLSSCRFVLFLSLAVTACTLAGRLDGFQYMFVYKNTWDPSWSLNGLFYVLTRSLSSDFWAVSFSAASLCFWLGVGACGRLSTEQLGLYIRVSAF